MTASTLIIVGMVELFLIVAMILSTWKSVTKINCSARYIEYITTLDEVPDLEAELKKINKTYERK